MEFGLIVASAASSAAAAVVAGAGSNVHASGIWSLAVLSQQIAYFQMIDCTLPDHYTSFASGTDVGRADFVPNPFENIEEASSSYDLMLTREETKRRLLAVDSTQNRILSRSNSDQIDPDDNTPALYRDTGFSSFFLVNSGQYLIVYLVVLAFCLTIIILSKLSVFQYTKIGSIFEYLRDSLAYVLPIKLIRYTTLELFIFSFKIFYYIYGRTSFWGIFNFLVAIIVTILALAISITSIILALINNSLQSPLPAILHGFFFELRTDRFFGKVYPIVYLVRNLLFAIFFVFLFSFPVAQIVILLIIALVHTICLIPFWIIYKSFIEGLLFFIISIVVDFVLILLLILAADLSYEYGMTTEGRLGVTWVIIIILAIALAIHFWVLVWYTYKGLKSLTTDEDGTNYPIDNNQSMSISKMNIPENYLKEEQNRLEELQAKNEPVDEQINLEFGTDDELERIRSTSQGKRRFIKKLGLQI